MSLPCPESASGASYSEHPRWKLAAADRELVHDNGEPTTAMCLLVTHVLLIHHDNMHGVQGNALESG